MRMWPKRDRDDGSARALDQVAEWVRFADTKATVLMAALGVVITLVLSQGATILKAAQRGEAAGIVIGALATLSTVAFVFALVYLVRALTPSQSADGPVNRFSWPLLASASMDDLQDRLASASVANDAWEQVLVLARTARRKYQLCAAATVWLAILMFASVTLVIAAALLAGN